MRVSSRTMSRPDRAICPACGSGELRRQEDSLLAGCDSCGRAFDEPILTTLAQIVGLRDATGEHACECGHPEMRRLPDGVFHCPACGSEVLPIGSISESRRERGRQ